MKKDKPGSQTVSNSEITFVRILFPYLFGIVVFYHLIDQATLLYLSVVCIVLFCCLLFINLAYVRLKAYRFKGFTGLLFYVFLFFSGGLSAVLHKDTIYPDYYADKINEPVNKKAAWLKVWVNDEPQLKNGILRFKAEVVAKIESRRSVNFQKGMVDGDANSEFDVQHVTGKLMISIKTDSLNKIQLNYGNELIIPYKYSEIEPPYNPGEFDYKFWLATQNIYYQTYLNQQHVIKLFTKKNKPVVKNIESIAKNNKTTANNTEPVVKNTKPAFRSNMNINANPLIAFALDLRARQVAYYRKSLKNDDAFAVAATLILGYRSDLSKDTLTVYSKTGTIHALSVSGMHVGLIYLVLTQLLAGLNRGKLLKLFKIALILSFIWFYALLTGFSPSVLRSAIMLSVFVIAKSFAKNTNNYNVIAFAAFCLLVYQPYLVWDVGFQLSFLAVIGLIYLQPKIENCWYIKNKWLHKVWSVVAMSLAAQLITYPLSIYYFHLFPVYFLLSNLFIMIPVALIMYLGIIILIARLDLLGPAFEWLINFTNSGLGWIADLPGSSLSAIFISKTELFALSISLWLFIKAVTEFKKQFLFASLASFILLQSLSTYNKLKAIDQKKIIVFNIRKHYATAFISSNEALVFTDLDPADKAFNYFIQPAMDLHLITKISCFNGDKNMVTPFLSLKNNKISFYNYQVHITDLRNYSLQKNLAYQLNLSVQ